MTVDCSLERFTTLRELTFSFGSDARTRYSLGLKLALRVLSTCGSRLHVLRFRGLYVHRRKPQAKSALGSSQDGGNPRPPYTFNAMYPEDDGLEQLDAIARTSDVLKELRELHFADMMGRDQPHLENLLLTVQRRLPVLLAQKGTQWSLQWKPGFNYW